MKQLKEEIMLTKEIKIWHKDIEKKIICEKLLL